MTEYYFNEQLRWSFGFENPNKAAALIASILPFLWICWEVSWAVHHRFLRVFAAVASAGVLNVGCWLLFKTYSRGGIVAAAVGFGYILWLQRFRIANAFRRRKLTPRAVVFAITAAVALSLFFSTEAARRSATVAGDRSVGNRLTLWKGAFRMISENPLGVGRGKSGEAYMQWYQPLEMTARYRTLVNSYLTFLAEQGFPSFAVASFVVCGIWFGTARQQVRNESDTPQHIASNAVVVASRASLVAFAAAGWFSTTMEEWKLWIVPAGCTASLVVLKVCGSSRSDDEPMPSRKVVLRTLIATLIMCSVPLASSWIMNRSEHLGVALTKQSLLPATISPSKSAPKRSVAVMVDEEVLGRDYGKLLRQLARETDDLIKALPLASDDTSAEIVVAAGRGVSFINLLRGSHLVLLAPARIEKSEALKILSRFPAITVLIPAFDEDGRSDFWRSVINGHFSGVPSIHLTTIEGVGTQMDWAWDQLISQIHK